MLPGFPKEVTTEKLGRGHYKLTRSDGYSITVRSSTRGDWYQTSTLSRRKSLRVFQYDMGHGFMPVDQCAPSSGEAA